MLKTRVAAVLLAPLFAIGAVAEETTRLGTRYQVVHGWPELPPGEILGAVTGRRLESWGAGLFVMPHGITIDRDDNVWLTDVGRHQVFKFSPDGRLLLALGEAGAPGNDERLRPGRRFVAQWQSEELGRPYAVDPAPGGRVFVADGGDQPEVPPDRSGVAITDAEGRMIARFGRFGNQDGQFRLAHDLAVASDGAVYVVDAWGQRVQKFIAH